MKKVLIRGPIINSAGYGVHARQIFKYLKNREDCELTTQITPWGVSIMSILRRKDLFKMRKICEICV